MSAQYSVSEERHGDELDGLQALCLPSDDPVAPAPGQRCWVAREDGLAAVAFIIMRPAYPGCWYLVRAGTSPQHINRGLYKRLLRCAFAAARRAQITEVVTDTAAWNLASANGLIGAGFKLYSPRHKWGWEDGLYWRKTL